MKLVLPALAALAVAAPAFAETPIAPGYWETTSQVISPIPTKKTEKRCIREEDVEKFMGGAPNRHYTCTYPTREVAGGKIRLIGSCKTKNSAPVPVTGEGVYTRDSLRLDARIEAKLGGMTVPVRARTSGKRIGDTCPAPPVSDGR
ncbi:DUF3617 domain-containing protein [Phenylobacterium sp. J367]|uniref:DUF3617 domain-containing protein n=1 Tax=Phenylobacterium sp. J367 TaxID=2898435 RepID=UPI002150BE33|nr:DUF3617 domain-containing protein [Phenylobacterium sp. J367]MCR5880036.1 DUF3617 domain-containing protein [Phenylobacterium sp. J367]